MKQNNTIKKKAKRTDVRDAHDKYANEELTYVATKQSTAKTRQRKNDQESTHVNAKKTRLLLYALGFARFKKTQMHS